MGWLDLVAAWAAVTVTLSGSLPAPRPISPSGTFRAGSGRADITPLPGIPMGGFSIVGRRARGHWARLYARAFYLEDAGGHPLLLVACDLWSMPAGLADRVAELVARAPEGRHVARAHMLLAATHTHHSPGNFSSAETYNRLASIEPGFDLDLFEFLARRIAAAAVRAIKSAEPARLLYGGTLAGGLGRNRSFEAFLLNPEAEWILRSNAGLPIAGPVVHVPHEDAYRAVDAGVRVIRAEAADGGRTIGILAFAAVHPTARGPRAELYGGDLFGVAAALAESRLAAAGNEEAVVAIFNGAEGDVSPNWREQGRAETMRLGGMLAGAIERASQSARALRGAGPDGSPVIESRWRKVRIAGRRFAAADGRVYRTAARGAVGAAALGGAEDGRTFLHALGWREGVRGEPTPEQGRKQDPYNPFRLDLELPWPVRSVLSLLAPQQPDVPRAVPLAVHRIGPLALATIPGEATTALGLRAAQAVKEAFTGRSVTVDRVLIVGLAEEYLSYFTTPEEYAAQHYEGGMTLYGPGAGMLLVHELAVQAAAAELPVAGWRTYRYNPGAERRFDPAGVGSPPARADEGLEATVQDLHRGRPVRDYPTFEWEDERPAWRRERLLAEVRIERETPEGWTTARAAGRPQTDASPDMAVVMLEARSRSSRWAAVWMVPPGTDGDARYRFAVNTIGGRQVCSAPFTVEAARAGGGQVSAGSCAPGPEAAAGATPIERSASPPPRARPSPAG